MRQTIKPHYNNTIAPPRSKESVKGRGICPHLSANVLIRPLFD